MSSAISRHRLWRHVGWIVFVALAFIAPPAVAQIPGLPPGVRPTPEEARQLLQTRPDLVQQLRQSIQSSGLTPDQIRARLRAEGYPEDLLDPYLAGADTTRTFAPAPSTLDAVHSLGIVSTATLDTLQMLDSLRGLSDSTRQIADSIRAARMDSLRRDSLADTLAARRGGLKLFGYEVFRRTSTRFQPAQTGPVDPNYRLGAGDVLVLILTGDVQLAHTLEVNREGFVIIPQVGQVYVANLTLGQLEDLLYTRLRRVYSGVQRGPNARTKFAVTVSRLRSIQVFVTGDVVRPGAYQISAAGTLLTALYAAGGPTQAGSFRRIDLRRGSRLVDSVDVYDYLLYGVTRTDVRLESGDVIFVPPRGGLVKLAGRVLRPAIYEIKPGETLSELTQAAGGLEPTAVHGRVQIHRIVPPGQRGPDRRDRIVIDVTNERSDAALPPFPLAAGDSITVFEVARRLHDFVTIHGNVYLEGQVGFHDGMHLSEAIRLAGGPRPDVFLGQILVSRVRPDSSRVQLRSAFADSTGRVTDDLVLQEEDEIRVFAQSTFRNERYVSVVGAVRRPGRVRYQEGMTLRDAVLLANGLDEDASLDFAEIARLPGNRPTGALAQTVRVPLDSSYRFEKDAAANGDSPVLQPYDNVLIPRQPGWSLQRLVFLAGQVRYPGRYALISKSERLSDLITRAGGLTSEAYGGGIEFWRFRDRPTATRDRVAFDPSHPVQPLPGGYRERVGLDLRQALANPTSRENIILAAGDSVFIPEFNPIVSVQGAVNAPGPVAYTPGKNLDWYVVAAGGYAKNGDAKRAYLTQPDGKRAGVQRRSLLSDQVPKPEPGATIFVPEKGPEGPSNAPAVLGVMASVLASLTTVVVLLTR